MADADFAPLTAEEKKQRDAEFASKLRRRSFTFYGYTDADVEYLRNIPAKSADYVIFGFEVSQSGKPHLQGYIEFSCGITGAATIARINHGKREKRGGITVLKLVKDIRDVQINYCKKEESGDPAMIEKYSSKWLEKTNVERAQGKRTDWHDMHDLIKDGKTFAEFAEVYPEAAIKYHGGIDRLIRAAEEKSMFEAFKSTYDNVVLRPWQQRIDDELRGAAGDRKILWIYETEGNIGKSWYSKYLVAQKGAVRFPNCRTQDLAMAYKGEPIVAFDFSRTVDGRVNYSVIEQLKDGSIFSSKYESRNKYFGSPHIVCFANWLPDLSCCSKDRWDIREINTKVDDVVEIVNTIDETAQGREPTDCVVGPARPVGILREDVDNIAEEDETSLEITNIQHVTRRSDLTVDLADMHPRNNVPTSSPQVADALRGDVIEKSCEDFTDRELDDLFGEMWAASPKIQMEFTPNHPDWIDI